jgi:hypothetical protein
MTRTRPPRTTTSRPSVQAGWCARRRGPTRGPASSLFGCARGCTPAPALCTGLHGGQRGLRSMRPARAPAPGWPRRSPATRRPRGAALHAAARAPRSPAHCPSARLRRPSRSSSSSAAAISWRVLPRACDPGRSRSNLLANARRDFHAPPFLAIFLTPREVGHDAPSSPHREERRGCRGSSRPHISPWIRAESSCRGSTDI